MKKLPPSKRMSKTMREPLEQGTEVAQFFKGHTDLLDKLVVEMYARGLSTRDIEDTLVMLRVEKHQRHQLILLRESLGIAEKEEVHV